MDFETIYHTYFNDVFRYIRRLSNNDHIAEEITADTFFKAMRSIDNFRGDCDIRVWLCQIAKNSYVSYCKKNSRMTSVEGLTLPDIPDPSETLDERLIRHDEVTQIQQFLHDLPEPYKEVFMWRVFAELSFKQIGQLFNKSENWACVTYHRARSKLKKIVEDSKHEK